MLEPPPRPLPGLAELAAGLNRDNAANGLVAFLFAATGPLAILLTVAVKGGLGEHDISSWIFAGYGLGGALSIVLSAVYRQPLGLAWTIPGAVLLGPALEHLSFPEAVGAYLATGCLLAVLGLSGWIRRIMAAVPLPVVMGMVVGVFLPIGLGIITAFRSGPGVAGTTLAVFLAVMATPRLARVFPPVLAALLVGVLALAGTGQFHLAAPMSFRLARPILYKPVFTARALGELVIPLTVSVLGIQNAQGISILRGAGYRPPTSVLTVVCGVGSLFFGALGSVPACVTGPVNAILNNSGERSLRYGGGIVFGTLMLVFALFSPLATSVALALPRAFVMLLGGLALLRVLQNCFATAFGGRCQLGALVAFLTTVSDIRLFSVGAAFWGLVFGIAASMVFEGQEFRASLAAGAAEDS